MAPPLRTTAGQVIEAAGFGRVAEIEEVLVGAAGDRGRRADWVLLISKRDTCCPAAEVPPAMFTAVTPMPT